MPGRTATRLFDGPPGALLFMRIYATMVVLTTGLGVVILLGGQERFSSPSFSSPRGLVNWVPGLDPWEVWGLIFLIYGIVLIGLMGRTGTVAGLWVGMSIYTFFAVGLAKSVHDSPVVAATGVVAYLCYMMIHAFLADYVHANGWR